MMRKFLVMIVFGLVVFAAPVQAQSSSVDLATSSAESSSSATHSGIVEKTIEKKPDLTEPEGEVKSKLERVLEENPVENLRWNNFLRYAIFQSVKNGVPVNTIVLMLLFPMVVAMVAASRHLLGIRGLGIFTPAMLSVAFLAMGIGAGVVLFVIILLVASVVRVLLRRTKLQYLPRMALLLWFVSFGVFGTFYLSSSYDFSSLIAVGIFPILILMLLAETFIDVQIGKSYREAMSLIGSTFLLAIVTSYVIGLDTVQRSVLLYPEVVFFGVALFDVFMGRYVGLRLFEYVRFRSLFSNRSDDEE